MAKDESQIALTGEEKGKIRIRREIGAFLVLLIVFAGYKLMFRKNEELNGIYTIAHFVIINEHNSQIPGMQYQYGNLTYTGKLTKDAERKVGGNMQFIIILMDGDPKKPHVIGSVPDCLENLNAPANGWKEIPTCP